MESESLSMHKESPEILGDIFLRLYESIITDVYSKTDSSLLVTLRYI